MNQKKKMQLWQMMAVFGWASGAGVILTSI